MVHVYHNDIISQLLWFCYNILQAIWIKLFGGRARGRLRYPAKTSPDEAGSFSADRGTHCALAFSAPGGARARGRAAKQNTPDPDGSGVFWCRMSVDAEEGINC